MKCKYCGEEALYPPKTKHSGWCCSKRFYDCPGYKARHSQSIWNKGLTKINDPRLAARSDARKGQQIGFTVGDIHTDETKESIAESMRGNTNANHRGDRQSYYNDIRMDSSWEVKTATYLDTHAIKWEYAPIAFILDEKRSYRPDFKLEDGSFIEVKGYWREANKIKFEEFKLKYPEINIDVWDKEMLKRLSIL